MRKHTPASRDLWENKHLYADDIDRLPADMQLTVHDAPTPVEDQEYLARVPKNALDGLIDQYRKDLLFEHDAHIRRDLREQIARLENEAKQRKVEALDIQIRRALTDPVEGEMTPAKAKAEAEWRQMVTTHQAKRAAK